MTRHIPVEELKGAEARCSHARVDCGECNVRALSVCGALEGDEIRELENLAYPASFFAKQTLFLEGDDADCVFNVVSGVVRIYRIFADGRRQVIGFPLPGDFVGLNLAPKRGFCADAVTPVTACCFPRVEFSELLGRKPDLMQAFHARSILELGYARDQVLALGRRSADEKIAWFLTALRARNGVAPVSPEEIPLPMSRQDIADYLGLTIETVSRVLQRFAREKLVQIHSNGVRVVDRRRIEALAAA